MSEFKIKMSNEQCKSRKLHKINNRIMFHCIVQFHILFIDSRPLSSSNRTKIESLLQNKIIEIAIWTMNRKICVSINVQQVPGQNTNQNKTKRTKIGAVDINGSAHTQLNGMKKKTKNEKKKRLLLKIERTNTRHKGFRYSFNGMIEVKWKCALCNASCAVAPSSSVVIMYAGGWTGKPSHSVKVNYHSVWSRSCSRRIESDWSGCVLMTLVWHINRIVLNSHMSLLLSNITITLCVRRQCTAHTAMPFNVINIVKKGAFGLDLGPIFHAWLLHFHN